MENVQLNIANKVQEISLRPEDFLQPLFEVVVNAIHAIEEQKGREGEIKIKIIRDENQKNFQGIYPIKSFVVEDNGIGFTEDNYNSFKTAYSQHRAKKGGKGVGRFTVLRAFKKMRVESKFADNGNLQSRSFVFAENGIDNKEEPNTATSSGSKVILEDYKEDFKKPSSISLEEILEKLMEHCLLFLLSKSAPAPKIILDEKDKDSINLQEFFLKSPLSDSMKGISCEKNDQKFELYFFKTAKTNSKYALCAHNRVVRHGEIKRLVPFLASIDYLIYLTGTYLDKRVNETRTRFKFSKKETPLPCNELRNEDIEEILQKEIEKKFRSEIEKVKKDTKECAKKHICNSALLYRGLLPEDGFFENITPDQTETPEKTSLALHEAFLKYEKETTELESKDLHQMPEDERRDLFRRKSIIHSGKLAYYLADRRFYIEKFRRLLEKDEKGKYPKEGQLHDIIFPRRKDSNDIANCEQAHNLWFLDDRYTFYDYIASDKPLSQIPTEFVNSNSTDRPDIFLYNDGAYVDDVKNICSVVLFEFKRPGDAVNISQVINQILDYARKIKKAGISGKRTHTLKGTVSIFGYIILDKLNEEKVDYLETENYEKTPFDSYYIFRPKMSFYLEVLSYDTLLRNVDNRHNAFFRKLKLE